MYDSRESSFKVGQHNITPFGLDIHNPVFLISGLTIVLFVLYALMLQEQASAVFGWLRPAITSTFDWFFLLAGNLFVIFALLLIFLPVGKVRLGGAEALGALQAMTVSTGLPFTIVLLAMCYSTWLGLQAAAKEIS